MKKIKNFIFTSKRGFFLDLEDARLAITVTPNDGDILFHEGPGLDRFDGVSVSGKAVQRFELARFNGMLAVNLLFSRGRQTEKYLIGITEDEDSALAWIERVNKIYEKNKEIIKIRSEGFRRGDFRQYPASSDR
jgi:hypothetical protein